MTTETAQSNEERVRAVYERPIGIRGFLGYSVVGIPNFDKWHYTEAESWAAAWEFTEAALEEVRQLKKAIELIGNYRASFITNAHYHNTCSFILAHMQALLIAKAAGMKPEAL